MKKDTVSIIMPTYNRADVILRAVKSILKQTYGMWELLIIDDGSMDETETVIAGLKDERIRYFKLKNNRGACYARNQGLAAAKGEYITFLDSDNMWEKIYLEERLAVLKKMPKNVGGVFGYTRMIRNDKTLCVFPPKDLGEKMARSRTNIPLVRQMLFENIIDTNTIVLRRECVESVSGFCEELQRLQDWEYFFRILYQSGYRIKFTGDCLVRNYLSKDSISHRSNDDAYWDARIFFMEKYRTVLEEYGCFEEVICQLCLRLSYSVNEAALDEKNLNKILNRLDADTVKKVVWLMHKEFIKIKKKADEKEGIARYFIWLNEKNNRILNMQSRWMTLMQDGIKLAKTMLGMGYQNIAIYGYGHLGRALYRELSGSGCHVAYIIDKRLIANEDGVEVIRPKANIQGVDAVIVTAVAEYENIKEKYEKKIPYISFADIIEAAEKEKIENE